MSVTERGNNGANVRIASFDVFDTLVTRSCGGMQSVFSSIEKRALSEGLNVDDFAEERLAAEKRALSVVGEANLRLEDIYTCLRDTYLSSVCDRLMEMEMDAEVDLCIPISGGVDTFRRCLETYDAVIIVSDMYLPERIIARILTKCGITGYARLYVSCLYGETKAEGSLYERVIADLKVLPNQITHYGDNLHSDVLSARRHGMKTIAMASGRETNMCVALGRKALDKVFRPRPGFLQTIDLSISENNLIERIGYCVLGPLLVSFSEWLHERMIACNLNGLWFAARDGLIMKRCYDLLYPEDRTEYLYASRRSTTVPMLCKNSDIPNLATFLGLGREMSVDEIFMRLGLTRTETDALREAYGFASEERLAISNLERDERFLAFYRDTVPLIEKRSFEELTAMATYCKRAFRGARAIGLVDLGWRGSIQHAICAALPEMGLSDVRLNGLYLGVDVDSAWWGSQSMEGFLFSPGSDEALGVNERWFNALVEALFLAPHGTVKRYVINEDGEASVEFEARDNDDSSPLFAAQDAALRFASDYKKRQWGEYGILKADDSIQALYHLGLEPTLAAAQALGDCVFKYQEVSCLARPKHGLGYYWFHPRNLMRELNVCYWKPAFLKRLAPLPVAYWRILACVKEFGCKIKARK